MCNVTLPFPVYARKEKKKEKRKEKKRQVSLYVVFVRRKKKIALVPYRKMYITLHSDFGTCDYNDCRWVPSI